jgi:hypothetical protein
VVQLRRRAITIADTGGAMIVLCFVVVALLSLTRVPTWLLVVLMLVPPVVSSAMGDDKLLLKAAVVALVAALVVYAPLAYAASLVLAGGFRAVFRRLRIVYVLLTTVLFMVVAFNLTQLIGVL